MTNKNKSLQKTLLKGIQLFNQSFRGTGFALVITFMMFGYTPVYSNESSHLSSQTQTANQKDQEYSSKKTKWVGTWSTAPQMEMRS